MSVAPPRRRSKAVFWIAAIVFAAAIVATFLLANDMRHLKALARRYDITYFDKAERPPVVAVKAMKTKGRLVREVRLPAQTFAQVKPELTASFVREWPISGETLCSRLTDEGLPVSDWKQSGFDRGTFECSYEKQDRINGELSSFFVIVRGSPSGDLTNVRLKIIIPDTPAGKAVRDKFATVAPLLIKQGGWSDFDGATQAIDALENVSQAAFGVKLAFSHEFEDPRRFNLIFGLERQTPEQRRTAAYFDASRWLPRPLPPLAGRNLMGR